MIFAMMAVMAASLTIASASKCTCTMPSEPVTGGSPMFKATAERAIDIPNSEYAWTLFSFEVEFYGCAPASRQFMVMSPKSDSSCGVSFTPGSTYLLTVRKSGTSTQPPTISAYNLDTFSVTKCNFNKLWESVPFDIQTKLYDMPLSGC